MNTEPQENIGAMILGWALTMLVGCIVAGLVLALTSCTVSVGPTGQPTLGVDPAAIVSAVQAWQTRHGAKAANVVIIDSSGKEVPAIPTAPVVHDK